MSQAIIKYYRGELTSQFSTTNAEKFGNGGHMQSQIVLEPRFKLYNAIEITEAEFPKFDYYQKFSIISFFPLKKILSNVRVLSKGYSFQHS